MTSGAQRRARCSAPAAFRMRGRFFVSEKCHEIDQPSTRIVQWCRRAASASENTLVRRSCEQFSRRLIRACRFLDTSRAIGIDCNRV